MKNVKQNLILFCGLVHVFSMYGMNEDIINAAKFGEERKIIECLLEGKLDINKADEHGKTPLAWAAYNGNTEVVKILLNHKTIDVNKADNCGRTPLYWAACNRNTEVVKLLLNHKTIDVNKASTKFGRTPLHWALCLGDTKVVKLLLNHKTIDVNKADAKFGRTPLHWALCLGDTEVVKLLLNHKDIDLNKDNASGQTPLCWAASKGKTEVVKLLLVHNADVNKADSKYRKIPLCLATYRGDTEVVKMLLASNKIALNDVKLSLKVAEDEGKKEVKKILQEYLDKLSECNICFEKKESKKLYPSGDCKCTFKMCEACKIKWWLKTDTCPGCRQRMQLEDNLLKNIQKYKKR